MRYPALGQQGKQTDDYLSLKMKSYEHIFVWKGGGWVIPEEETVTKLEQTILSPS